MSTVAELEVLVGADTAGLERGLNQANNQTQSFARRAGRNIARFGAMAGGALLAVGGLAVNAAINWESSWANVVKTVDASEEELATLETTLRDMATSPVFGALENAHDTLAGIAAMAGQLGVETSAIDEFTESIAALTVATDLTAEEAAMFAAQFANVTGMDVATEIDNLADTIVTLGNNLATTETQIVNFGNRLAGLTTAGFEPDQILAWGGAMASVGITAELGATNFSKFVNEMQRFAREGGPELETMANVAGMTADEFAELALNDPSAAMDAFIGGLSEMDQSEVPVVLDELNITGNEQRQVITKLAAGYDTVTQALALADEAFQGNGAAMAEAEAKANTTEGTLNNLNNTLTDIGITVGDAFLPAVNDLAEGLAAFLEGDHDTAIEELGNAFTNLGTAIGTITFGDQDFDFQDTLDQWSAIGVMAGDIFETIGLKIQTFVFRIQDIVDDFFRGLQITILQGLADILNSLPEQVTGAIPELDLAISGVNLALEGLKEIENVDQLADNVSQSVNQQIADTGHIDFVAGMVENPEGDALFMDQVVTPQLVAELDPETLHTMKADLEQQLVEAVVAGDEEMIEFLLPLATQLEIDLEDVYTQAEEAIRVGVESGDMDANVYVNLTLIPVDVDTSRVNAAVSNATGGTATMTAQNVDGPYHGGGIFTASGGAREGLALLQSGEGVFTRDQMQALGLMANTGGRGGGTTNIYSYGKNPNEIAYMVDRANRDMGYAD